MNLYLLTQEENTGYDTYSSVVVCAHDKEEAIQVNPGGLREWSWAEDCWHMFFTKPRVSAPSYDTSWANKRENIKCTHIGKANKGLKRGVICASFHAG